MFRCKCGYEWSYQATTKNECPSCNPTEDVLDIIYNKQLEKEDGM